MGMKGEGSMGMKGGVHGHEGGVHGHEGGVPRAPVHHSGLLKYLGAPPSNPMCNMNAVGARNWKWEVGSAVAAQAGRVAVSLCQRGGGLSPQRGRRGRGSGAGPALGDPRQQRAPGAAAARPGAVLRTRRAAR